MNSATVARQLIVNTLVSGAGIFWTTVFGLIVTPVIISNWGVAALGLIVLARLLLPTGVLALLDLGVSEVTIQLVARARVSGAWEDAFARINFLFKIATGIGLAIALALWITAPLLTRLFAVPPEYQSSFESVARISAVVNLLLIPTLVCEGIIKGFEKYTVVRGLDVAASGGYLLGTVLAVYLEATYATVAILYIGIMAVRAACCFAVAWYALRSKRYLVFHGASKASREDLHRCWLMFQNRIVNAVIGPGLPLAVGALFGPHAVGIYDTVTRLPRASKVVGGLLTSAVLPVASRLDQGGRSRSLSLLAYTSMVILPAVTVPPLVAAALLSTSILDLWVGPTIAAYGPWMSLLFLVPITQQFINVGGTMLLTRAEVQLKLNLLAALQIPIIIVVTALTYPGLQERALMLGQVIGVLAVFPLQTRILTSNLGLALGPTLKTLAVQAAVLGALGLMLHYLIGDVPLDIAGLVVVIAGWCLMAWSLEYLVAFTRKERDMLRELTRVTLSVVGWRPASP